MAQEIKSTYPCTQQELYSVADTIYDNCMAHLAQFTAYKPKYTAAYINGTLRVNVTTAKLIPDEEMRNSVFQILRTELISLAKQCTDNFQLLKGYINDAFPKTQHKIRYDAAGQTYYADAAHENWERVVGMNSAMKLFIEAELPTLTANDNMPPAFQLTVLTDSDDFDDKYNQFKTARETSDETAQKITANNLVYQEVISLCDDGQRIFINNEALHKLFVFETVKKLISPPGSAGLKVHVKKQEDNTPVPNTTITIQAPQGTPITATTDQNGEATFTHIDPAAYNGTATPPSPMNPATFTKEVNTGTSARKDIFLT